jgi:phosphatidylglycerophosphate synthase
LLVTGIRAEMERQGVQFGAKLWGKLKTVVQMGAIPIIILALTLAPQAAIPGGWVSWLNHTLAILMVVTTLFSSVPYVKQAVSWMSRDDAGES